MFNFPKPTISLKQPGLLAVFVLFACAKPTSPNQQPIIKLPEPSAPIIPQISEPPVASPTADEDGVFRQKVSFDDLPGWQNSDVSAAFRAFLGSCRKSMKQKQQSQIWETPCRAAFQLEKEAVKNKATSYRSFFEQEFVPYSLSIADRNEGLLTAYYEPELIVSAVKTKEFSQPLLPRPEDLVTVSLRRMDPSLPDKRLSGRVVSGELQPYFTRKEILQTQSNALAWGRPIDVFFLQIQGSGRIRYSSGEAARAAFSGHNGQPYKSIGKELILRGELERGKASKAAIENWMKAVPVESAQELMNANPRYVFFEKQPIKDPKLGPKGTQGVALTAKASIAIDTAYHSFNSPIWIDTRLPKTEKDWSGTPVQFLAIAQDTGGAIKGPLRGDLFYGSGKMAGKMAGIQKHPARWWTLMPKEQSKSREIGA